MGMGDFWFFVVILDGGDWRVDYLGGNLGIQIWLLPM